MSHRPQMEARCFRSEAVEEAIIRVSEMISDKKLASMFASCLPNTLDTTVQFDEDSSGRPDTFVITGDIEAMWLRDSTNQVWPYLRFATQDSDLQLLLAGVINRQVQCVLIDPYGNAFNKRPRHGVWHSDLIGMSPYLHERKYELDSLCSVVRLSHGYYRATDDTRPFDSKWCTAMLTIMETIRNEQAGTDEKDARLYRFQRVSPNPMETLAADGYGQPARRCGLSKSPFRPSDDAALLPFHLPANALAVVALRQLASLFSEACGRPSEASDAIALANEIDSAIQNCAVVDHPEHGEIFAYEVDGFGSYYLMDDANVPSLISLPYLGYVEANDPIYLRTRSFALSLSNPYYCVGAFGGAIGSPHTGIGTVWPMSMIIRALTSCSEGEIVECLRQIRDTDAGTGFIHESFSKDDPDLFSRPWFAWANTIFGELILTLSDRTPELLKAI